MQLCESKLELPINIVFPDEVPDFLCDKNKPDECKNVDDLLIKYLNQSDVNSYELADKSHIKNEFELCKCNYFKEMPRRIQDLNKNWHVLVNNDEQRDIVIGRCDSDKYVLYII